MTDEEKKGFEGEEQIPVWVLRALDSRLAGCEWAIRDQAKRPQETSAYFLREMSKQLLFLRELVRTHGKLTTVYMYDLPPYTAKKPKKR